MNSRGRCVFFLFAVALYATTAVAADSGYPERPVRVIVTFPPGGGTDIVARMVFQKALE